MSRLKNENFYSVTGWMIKLLELKGIEVNVYAIIYGFSQDGKTEYLGGRKYLSEFIGVSLSTIDRCLSSLVQKDLIIKIEQDVRGTIYNNFKVNLDKIPKPSDQIDQGSYSN